MESNPQLDAACGTSIRLTSLLFFVLVLPALAFPQAPSSAEDRTSEVKQMYDEGRWDDVIRAIPESSNESADLEFYRGLSLAKLMRWEEAQNSFEAGLKNNPRDTRFMIELGGIAYREKQFSEAKHDLLRALSIDSNDAYTNDFLASIYFLEGNLEAALKYWNRTGKPVLADVRFDPKPKLDPLVFDRAFPFSPGTTWRRDQFLSTVAKLEALDLYPSMRFDLQARPDGQFDLVFRGSEKNGWGRTKVEGVISLLRGLPYQSIYPEFYNLNHKGLNWRSFIRWDDQKRRVSTELSAPLEKNPAIRYRIYLDGRNENWNISNRIVPAVPSISKLNMETADAGAEISFIPSGHWQGNFGVEYSYRTFRNLFGIPTQAASFFTNSSGIDIHSDVQRVVVRFPERRLTFNSRGSVEAGTFFTKPLGRYARVTGALEANWFPRATNEDYQTTFSLTAGRTFGLVPFDKLVTLGFDRDNPLWLRGHPSLRDGQKGNAPMGRNFIISNWETDKIVYAGPFFSIRMAPFLDTGRIYDPSQFFGSTSWLYDTGLQAKVRVLSRFELILGYGKDLRAGRNSFFMTVTR